jgi:hypothetical protein
VDNSDRLAERQRYTSAGSRTTGFAGSRSRKMGFTLSTNSFWLSAYDRTI